LLVALTYYFKTPVFGVFYVIPNCYLTHLFVSVALLVKSGIDD
jgi:hypothetical protein